YHVYSKYKIYTKTISAQKSLKKEKNSDKWRHPDIVGVYFPNWEKDIVDISKDTGSFGIKLFSYELKKELNLANLRERYFQAVSNSSWANEGYLVASEIDDNDEEFMAECKRLSSAFGIGLMKISIDDPDQSKILFQAKVKDNIDIETMNLLPKINKDFKDFITDVKADYDTYPRIRSKYDKVISTEELYK
ncbi:MAG: HrgA protein, partial [Helicobacteraceae bacterium]|nr:HrgA protein [Helicobacteraceae bacterium]